MTLGDELELCLFGEGIHNRKFQCDENLGRRRRFEERVSSVCSTQFVCVFRFNPIQMSDGPRRVHWLLADNEHATALLDLTPIGAFDLRQGAPKGLHALQRFE